LLINELIREYLIFNGYRNTLSVFEPETGQPQQASFDSDFLQSYLRLSPTTESDAKM
jgi:lisH domain-containing protein FOPNL